MMILTFVSQCVSVGFDLQFVSFSLYVVYRTRKLSSMSLKIGNKTTTLSMENLLKIIAQDHMDIYEYYQDVIIFLLSFNNIFLQNSPFTLQIC